MIDGGGKGIYRRLIMSFTYHGFIYFIKTEMKAVRLIRANKLKVVSYFSAALIALMRFEQPSISFADRSDME